MACIRSCGTSPTLKSLARGHRQLKPELRLVFRRADISKGTYPSMEKDSLQCSGHWGGTLFDGGRVSACFEIGRTKMSLCRATLFALAAGTLLCTASYALDPPKEPSGEVPVFRIGVVDGSSAEFSPEEPGTQAPFVVGQSVASKDWYATQPAVQSSDLKGERTHGPTSPRVIKFVVAHAPLGTYTLKVPLLFEGKSTPAMRVAINGKTGMFYPSPKLDGREGDINAVNYPAYSTADIVFTFPSNYLHLGVNMITLQAVEEGDEPNPGAGFKYDAIELDWNGPAATVLKSSVRIEPTVFFRR
ncbi:MAG TPA: polysaccharide lyase family protein [Acidobacteriaceae bacterium]|nr:polysaccharide lyase family protein [Acidobacteriaceae bacterium]